MSFQEEDYKNYRAMLESEAWLKEEYKSFMIEKRSQNMTGNLVRDLEGYQGRIEDFEKRIDAVIADLNKRKEWVKEDLDKVKHRFLVCPNGKEEYNAETK